MASFPSRPRNVQRTGATPSALGAHLPVRVIRSTSQRLSIFASVASSNERPDHEASCPADGRLLRHKAAVPEATASCASEEKRMAQSARGLGADHQHEGRWPCIPRPLPRPGAAGGWPQGLYPQRRGQGNSPPLPDRAPPSRHPLIHINPSPVGPAHCYCTHGRAEQPTQAGAPLRTGEVFSLEAPSHTHTHTSISVLFCSVPLTRGLGWARHDSRGRR